MWYIQTLLNFMQKAAHKCFIFLLPSQMYSFFQISACFANYVSASGFWLFLPSTKICVPMNNKDS